jgi:DNA-binding NarL/FixJ family response regulator
MTPDRSAPIIIADCDAASRRDLSKLAARAGFATVEVATGAEALAAMRVSRPALVVLELRLPDVNGFELCREVRDEFGEQLPIVFLSADRTDSLDRSVGFLVGGDDYIVKPFDPDELLARVRRLITRSSRVRAAAESRVPAAALTGREREVLVMLAEGLRSKAIARELVISPKTVSSHIQRILTKLDVHSRAEAVALAYREGLVPDATAHGGGPNGIG